MTAIRLHPTFMAIPRSLVRNAALADETWRLID
jgi:hypothetical protein